MSSSELETWHPRPEQIANANVTEVIRRLGVKDYDALLRYSIERPEDYWRTIMDYCGLAWSKPYTQFVDLSAGREFPRWFVDGEINWTDAIFRWARDPATAGRAAVVAEAEDGSVERLSFAELHDRVRALAAGLQRLGIRRGDRIGYLMDPGLDAVVSMIALSYVGAVIMPLFSGFGVDPIVARLEASGARALLATAGFNRRGKRVNTADVAIAACARHPVDFLILRTAPGEAPPPGTIALDSLPMTPAPDLAPAAMGANEPVMIFYTSGTTGKPKGTVHVHGGFPLKVIHDGKIHFDIKEGDVFFWPADMGWVAGALIITSVLTQGATMLCYNGAPDFPDWSRMAQLIGKHRVTHFGSAPTMIRGFAANAEAAVKGDLSSIRLMITGGEVIDPEHFAWHAQHFGRGVAPLINFSGGTEVSSGLVASVMLRPILPGSFNTATPGIAVDVVNAQGESVVDEVGELAIREPFVGMTRSFWEDDERYLDTYWRTIPGLWVHGDLAIRTRNGDWFLRGRSDDTLKLAGKRIGPAEIENVLMELDGVSECAAIGVDDAAKGQVLVVFVIASGAARDDPQFGDVVARHAEARLGKALRPGRVHVVQQMPKTRTAKIMRRVIRGIYCGTPTGDLSSLDNPSSLEEITSAARRAAHRS